MSRVGNRVGTGWVNRFWFALEYNDLHTIHQMIQQGIDLDHVFKQQGHQRHSQTGVFIAVAKQYVELARKLIRAGCNLEHRDMWGETPLFSAVRRGKMPMVQLLIDGGANINCQNKNKESVIFLAIKAGHKDMVKYLISCGASVDFEDHHGSTPIILVLHLLAQNYSSTTRQTRRRAPHNMADILEIILPHSKTINVSHPIKGSALRLAISLETTHTPKNIYLSKMLLQVIVCLFAYFIFKQGHFKSFTNLFT